MINVLLEAPILTQSGYGEHSRLVFRALMKTENVRVYINPLDWASTSWASSFDSKDKENIQTCIADLMHAISNNMQPDFDIQIHVGILNKLKNTTKQKVVVCYYCTSDELETKFDG